MNAQEQPPFLSEATSEAISRAVSEAVSEAVPLAVDEAVLKTSPLIPAPDLALLVAGLISLIILGLAAVVLYRIYQGSISLQGIISETGPGDKPAKASLSRFQFLVFTFVIAGLYLVLSLESGNFVDIPDSVLLLMGISGGSYLASKQIGKKPQTSGGGNDGGANPNPDRGHSQDRPSQTPPHRDVRDDEG